jgi:hypothetical protein
MADKIEYFKPKFTTDLDLDQAFLNQILVPKISNNNHPLSRFFKKDSEALDIESQRSALALNKIIPLNANYGCDFESYMRNSKLKERKEHIKFMQSIKTHQLAALSPYAQFYVVDSKNLKKSTFKKTAIPISFGKGFDLDFFLKNKNSTSRGEGAGLISISANRVYNITGDYDPITLSAQFFFSSYEVLINKPAIEKSSLAGLSYNGNNFGAFAGFFNSIQSITYKELIKRSNDIKLVLEYGWTYSDGVSDDILSRKEKELIDKFEKVYYKITPITHKINFKEDGSFTLDVQYIPAPLADLEDKPGLGDAVVDKILSKEIRTTYSNSLGELRGKIKVIENALKVQEAQKSSGSLVNPRIKRLNDAITKTKNELSAFLKENKSLFAKFVIEDFKENNLFNSYKLTTGIETSNGIKTINNIFNVKIGRKEGNPDISYFESAKSDNKFKLDNVSTLEDQVVVMTFMGDAFPNDGNPKKTLSDVGKNAKKIINSYFTKTSPKQGETSFIFFKDILRGIYDLSEKYDKVNNIQFDLPYYILGNVAYPLPNGNKYWCNIGDLAFTENSLKQALIDFFKNYPNANFKKFINFFVQKVIPTVVVNRSNIAAFPSLSYPYYHFDETKYQKDFLEQVPGNKQISLFQGDSKAFEDFCVGYFDSADIRASNGCFFIGQSSNLLYENSGIFLGKRVANFRENYFKKDSNLLDTGISKLIIGSSNGLLQKISFNSNSDDTLTNLSHVLNEKKPGIADDIISTNYQYTIGATLFGNRIYEFSNLIYVPSYTLGKGVAGIPDNPTPQDLQRLREQNRSNDFEIGGLYTINNVSDNLQLAQGTYTKTINASTLIRDSQLLLAKLKDLEDNKVLFPANDFNETISSYIADNYDSLSVKADKIELPPDPKFAAAPTPLITPSPPPASVPSNLFGGLAGEFKQFPEG